MINGPEAILLIVIRFVYFRLTYATKQKILLDDNLFAKYCVPYECEWSDVGVGNYTRH